MKLGESSQHRKRKLSSLTNATHGCIASLVKIACHANKFLIERMNPRDFEQFTHVPIPNILPW